MKKRIHVSQPRIRNNVKTGARDPAISIVTSKGTQHAHEVVIKGPSKMIYSPDKPLSCGARLWIETDADVDLIVHDYKKIPAQKTKTRTAKKQPSP